ncbi:hypothetical protein D3C84_994510 [compost metagenome]
MAAFIALTASLILEPRIALRSQPVRYFTRPLKASMINVTGLYSCQTFTMPLMSPSLKAAFTPAHFSSKKATIWSQFS